MDLPKSELYCDNDGCLYLVSYRRDGDPLWRYLGEIDEAGDDVPDVLWVDYKRLLDEWRHGFDPRAEAEAAYRAAKGM